MPHVSERQPKDDDKATGKPSGELGGHPINADETAPRETVPEPNEGGGQPRQADAVDGEPGSDL